VIHLTKLDVLGGLSEALEDPSDFSGVERNDTSANRCTTITFKSGRPPLNVIETVEQIQELIDQEKNDATEQSETPPA
jgi:hypothetical protein